MREDKGITLISLVVYIIGMVAIIAVVGSLLSFYNNNMVKMNDTSDVNMELSKFTARMIAETKDAGNEITEIAGNTIKFKSGNVYTYQDNRIYENTMVVSQYVKDYLASLEVNGSKQILRIHIVLQKGETEITNNLTYVIEETKGKVAMGPTYIIDMVEPGVYGNLYKISDTEYHLIFNTTGDIAEGYTEAQLVERGTNIVNGIETIQDSEGVWQLTQPWGTYSDNITKVYIEERIVPKSTQHYFLGLSKVNQINGIELIDTSNVTNMKAMFMRCRNLVSLNISSWNTNNVTDMQQMFKECNNLASLDVSGWNTNNVTDMQQMFRECNNLTSIDISKFDTSNVTNMYGMFAFCDNLTSINISGVETRNVANMAGLFNGCSKLEIIDLSGFDTSKVINMNNMFLDCVELKKIYVGDKWTTSAVASSNYMFSHCTSLSGAIAYDANKVDANYANYTTGYFTKKYK